MSRIYMNYEDIIKNEPVVIDFLTKKSTCFSVTTVIKNLIHNYHLSLTTACNYSHL